MLSFRNNFLVTGGLLLAAAIGFTALLYIAGLAVQPDMSVAPPPPPAEIAAAESARRMAFDPKNPVVLVREVDYSRGPSAAWWPKHEAPILQALVREGVLPPVDQRVGQEPLVLEGPEGIGRYGGSWQRLANSESDRAMLYWRLSGAGLVRWSPQGYPIVPHLASSWSISPDKRAYTFTLRQGLRWSDGAPVTSDDLLYWWENEARYFDLTPRFMMVAGANGRVEKIDERRVRFVFDVPNGLFLERLASNQMLPEALQEYMTPAHYLRPFHPKIGDPALITRTMRELSSNSPVALYKTLKQHINPEHPRLWPWVYRRHRATPPYVYVRNPYYYAVDPEGHQLPYLDRLVLDVKTQDLIGIAAASGQISMQDRHIRYDDHVLLTSEARANNYQVYHWPNASQSLYTIFPVLNRKVDPARPETGKKSGLLNDKRFRQALSLAINRQEVIDAEFNGQTEPAQIDAGKRSPYHNPDLFHAFTAFDPAKANRLLDEIGLTQRDREGFRKFRDGTRMTFFLETTDTTPSGPSQFIIDDWAAVGVRAILRVRARSLFLVTKAALEHDFSVHTGESEFMPLVDPFNFVPTHRGSFFAPAFGYWYQNGGFLGATARPMPTGASMPPLEHPLRRAMEILNRIETSGDESERQTLFHEITAIAAENLWHISICTPPPQLVVVKNGFHNVPRVALFGAIFQTPANAGMETYFEETPLSPAVYEETQGEIASIIPLPRIGPSGDDALSGRAQRWLGWLAGIACVLMAGLVAARHPFILRRLLIMAPTLLVISAVVFAMIRLPPGDFLEVRMQELSLTGDLASEKQMEDLRRSFHLDASVVEQYARWMGLYWFKSFASADEGLLQGNLGRSMEHNQPVNRIVGDRILLTVVVTSLTVLFTWLLAVPIGIYAAVRQYSAGDYFVTFAAFLGMSVPAFLFAIVIVYFSKRWFGISITGLFSPEFASQVGWSRDKVIDLFKHVWLPVVVLGLGGTASMVRVMRANLLDELRKPYVTTARAKGLGELRLLLKYPARLALNPFISGIGAYFPQLVSGGAIVAMVLNLPMIGPAMLSALMAEDTYFAGSMLMILSLLGVLGTLLSDLLLLWLDPRIRLGEKK